MKTQTNLLLKTFCCGRIRSKGFYPNSDEEYGEDGLTRLMKERLGGLREGKKKPTTKLKIQIRKAK